MRDEEILDPERRGTGRFPIESELRYKTLSKNAPQTGSGRTLNMSSSGVLFTSETPLQVGSPAEVSVDWPAQLNENCGLKLVALGKIVRSNPETAVIRIEKYDFRTRSTAGVKTAGSAK